MSPLPTVPPTLELALEVAPLVAILRGVQPSLQFGTM